MRILALLCLALAACSPSDAKSIDDYAVTLSSVNLGADCWTPPAPKQPPATPPVNARPPAKPSVVAPADECVGAGCPPRHCDQTSMQILIKATGGLKNAPVK